MSRKEWNETIHVKYEDLPRELEFFPRVLTRAQMKRLGKTWGRRK